MNYLKHYILLMRKAESRKTPPGYVEKHHVFPKSIFGNNKRIVVLTAREHYVAHVLLEKAFISRYGEKHHYTIKMTYAHTSMKGNGGYTNSLLYESARIRRSEAMKGKVWYKWTDNNKEQARQRMLGHVQSQETREKRGDALRGRNRAPFSEETKRRMKENHADFKGENHPMYDKNHTEEAKESISKTNSQRWRLTFEDGRVIVVEGISRWCRENEGYCPTCISGVFYKRKNVTRHKDIIKVEKLS